MKKLKTVLLIDDDYATNFLHQIYIEKFELTENIVIATNGKHALEILFDENLKLKLVPDLIFLDINMPILNGWGFLEEYKKRTNGNHESIIIMLTASINPDDVAQASTDPYIYKFYSKPINEGKLKEICNEVYKD